MAKLTKEEWNKIVTEYYASHDDEIGIPKDVPLQGEGDFHPYVFPLCYRTITDDMIRVFSCAIGDDNPMWTNKQYAEKARYGGIVAPPMCELMISECPGTFPPAPVDGISSMNGGSKREYFAPIRPFDSFTAKDTYLGTVEKSNPAKPYRLFMTKAQREVFNQNGELAVRITSTLMVTARYSEDDSVKQEAKSFKEAKMRRYTDEELAQIHAMYDDELSGKYRRGAEIRYWEDVNVGDEIHAIPMGPYDLSDAVSFFGVTGFSQAFAVKWKGLRNGLEGARRDPDTNEYSLSPLWHFSNDLAHTAGAPLAPIFGSHMEATLSHAVTNWMGDDGTLKEISTRIQSMGYLGDTLLCGGRVVGKRQENGENLIDLELAAVEQVSGRKCTVATAVVALKSKEA